MMKRILLGFPAFFVAFLVGVLFFEPVGVSGSSILAFLIGPSQNCASSSSEGSPAPGFNSLPDLASTTPPKYPIQLVDLFENGTFLIKGDKSFPDSDAQWLGLIENNGSSSIQPVDVELGEMNDLYRPDRLQIKVQDAIQTPVFIFKTDKSFNIGPVTTLYHRPSKEEIGQRRLPLKSMAIGYTERFLLNNVPYELSVVPGATSNGTKLNVLVLGSEGKNQILVSNRHYDRNDRIGDLLWVGDLDGDQKLDLYFDDFDFGTGNFGSNLFLSSEADAGSLVKQVAFFESLEH